MNKPRLPGLEHFESEPLTDKPRPPKLEHFESEPLTDKPRPPELGHFESEPLSASKLRDEPDWALVERITGKKCPETVSLRALSRMTETELKDTLGLTDIQGKKLGAALILGERLANETIERGMSIKSGEDVYRIFKGQMKDAKKEGFYAMTMNHQLQVIDIHQISEGTLSMCPVHPRETFNPIIRDSAAAVIFMHNHPSGFPEPSKEDFLLTERLNKAGKLLGIRVLDHVVIGDRAFVSLRDRGVLGKETGKETWAAENAGGVKEPLDRYNPAFTVKNPSRHPGNDPGEPSRDVASGKTQDNPDGKTRTFLVAPRKNPGGSPSPDYTGLIVIGKTPHKVDLWKDGQIQIARRGPDRFTAVGGGQLVPTGSGELSGSVPVFTAPDIRTSVDLEIHGLGEGTPIRLSVSEGRPSIVLQKTKKNERGIER